MAEKATIEFDDGSNENESSLEETLNKEVPQHIAKNVTVEQNR